MRESRVIDGDLFWTNERGDVCTYNKNPSALKPEEVTVTAFGSLDDAEERLNWGDY